MVSFYFTDRQSAPNLAERNQLTNEYYWFNHNVSVFRAI